MKQAFIKKYTVEYSDVGNKRIMKPSRLVDCFQMLAVAHSDAAGYDLDWFAKEKLGWILLFWHIKIDRLPKEGETLTMSTWTKPYKRAQAQRDFAIEDERGQEVAYAASRWVLMDTVKRRPAKMKEGFFDSYVFENSRALSDEDFQMPSARDENFLGSRTFQVTRRDTDTNDHANNLVYIEWAFDDLSDEIYKNASVVDIRAAYKKECRRETTVKSAHYITHVEDERSERGKIQSISVFTDAENEEVVFGQVTSLWQMNE